MAGLNKVSFSFSKITKKPTLQAKPVETVKKVDKIEYISSVEDNTVKLLNAPDTEENKPLVIPLQHPNLLIQSVIDTVNSRKSKNLREDNEDSVKDDTANDESSKVSEKKTETLEEMAARELLEDATNKVTKKPDNSNIAIPLAAENYDTKESSLEDYESIPVNNFGLAMLRGMGWDPKKGIGKNGQVIKVTGPTVRPKGLGLGADKAIMAQKPVGKNVSEKEVLGKGSKVRVTIGNYKNLYGTVEGFDDDGRIIVFMAISSEKVWMNENFVQLVNQEEFTKYSKVININAYNNYKEKEQEKGLGPKENSDEDRKSTIIKKDTKYKNEESGSHSRKCKDYNSSEDSGDKSRHHKDNIKKSSKKYHSESEDSDRYLKSSSKSKSRRDKSQDYKSSKNHKKDSKMELKSKKQSKKYSDSDDSSEEDYKSKRKNERSRRNSSSDESNYKKHKKSKKKRDRSRSRR